jgi:hypothetical protein
MSFAVASPADISSGIKTDASMEDGVMRIQSAAFSEGGMIPRRHTCDGGDISPRLSWSGTPVGSRSLVLICDDPDARVETWVHWVLFAIPPDSNGLPEGVSDDETISGGAVHGRNDFGILGYGGPCPPPGPPHRYYFKLYSVDIELDLGAGATKQDVMSAIEGHILAEAQLMGRYGRAAPDWNIIE